MTKTQELRAEPDAEPVEKTVIGSAGKIIRITPDFQFKTELAEFGGTTFNLCYQCATCSTVCVLSPDEAPFPRKEMAWAQWGLKDRLLRDADLWECHFCGDCSDRCPRGADPGESMMALRRWAISQYDWTGLSRKLYTSRVWEIGALVVVALVVVGLFALSGSFSSARMITSHVSVNTFIPVKQVHYADWTMAAVLTFFLLTNSWRMARFILGGQKVPLSVFLSEAMTFFLQVAVQKNWQKCKGEKIRWLKHFILVTGYSTLFVLVMFFLKHLQVDSSEYSWVSILGYYTTIAIIYFATDAIISRIKKEKPIHRYSHDSDWMFLILLLLTGITGITMHAVRLMGLPMATYIIYVVHLAIAVPMLVVEVPFMKWSHLMYRPLAQYLRVVKVRARQLKTS